ncbi:MAG TPA: hypothetical protein VFN25_07395 [Dokdonella sp.]|uniref:dioxygenase family protein n=1 Tax=Dokdonella sp. TaxID=2291710 RepID=UPI002D800D9C|nr:hypothetical protein [Dokdonella sp.]HET9032713.1 hypothetical protein [Dokdonella sp.]
MKSDRLTFIGAAIVLTLACAPLASWAQADPSWLKSWNEAQQSRPQAMTPNGRIAKESEPGRPMVILGQVFGAKGKPAEGVVVHAYHRDNKGFDFGLNDDALTTWRLQGWARTGADGRFQFQTIRPAADHMGREGAHIHFTLETSDFGRQWAPKVFLADDPLVTTDQRRRSTEAGKFGWVREVETQDGVQQIRVKFQLKNSADF